MPRAIWSGSISFGLVNIPIKLYNAVSKKSVSFNQIDAKSGSRVRMKRVSATTGEEVAQEDILKGYELSPDRYVTIQPEELEALDPEATRAVDLEEFVDLVDIDPIFYDSPYYIAPTKGAEKPYTLLVRAMEESGKVGIARFVMRSKQYLAALRPKDGKLLLSTMVYADEISDEGQIGEFDMLGKIELSDRELAMAQQLIESLSGDFEPEKYRDEYRERVLDLIRRKSEGVEEVVEAPAAIEPTKVVDLMAALEASVKEAQEARTRHPAAADEKAPAKKASGKKTAKRAPAKKKATAKSA
jgi:DNA end-binding protein Ku